MPCIDYGNATVCTSGVREIRRMIRSCPVCERRRRFVIVVPVSPYYSHTMTCLGCGDSWEDGERHERPFQRGWRQKAQTKARQQWTNAFRQTPEQRAEWERAWLS